MLKFIFNERIMILMIVISIIPLMFVHPIYNQTIYLILFIYFSTEFCYDFKKKLANNGKIIMIIDLLSTISLLTPFHALVVFRFTRIFKLLYLANSTRFVLKIFKAQKHLLLTMFLGISVYIMFIALIMFNIEPSTFDNSFFKAFYFSAITLTTVGYGDITPVTMVGQAIVILSSIIGIGIIALPTGVIAGEFFNQYNKKQYVSIPKLINDNINFKMDTFTYRLSIDSYFDLPLYNQLTNELMLLDFDYVDDITKKQIANLLEIILKILVSNQDKDNKFYLKNDADIDLHPYINHSLTILTKII